MLQNKTTHFKVTVQNTLCRDAAQTKTRTTSIITQHRSANIELKAFSILFSALTVSHNMQKYAMSQKRAKSFIKTFNVSAMSSKHEFHFPHELS